MNLKNIFVLILGVCVSQLLCAQDIALGTWRTHLSYTEVAEVVLGDSRVYASVGSGLFYFDQDDNSVNRLTELDGLQGGGISALAYDETRDVLLVGYASGNMDLVTDEEIINLDLISDSQVIGSKKINDILVAGAFAYLATDYGVLKFAVEAAEVRETYREIGDNGTQIVVRSLAIYQDSLFIASSAGIRAGSLSSQVNLADWRFWLSKPVPSASQDVTYITLAADRLFAALDGEGIFVYENAWLATSATPASSYSSLNGSPQALVTVSSDGVQALSPNDLSLVDEPVSTLLVTPIDAVLDSQDQWWIGDGTNGLISDWSGTFSSYSPSGPASSNVFTIRYQQDSIYILTGGYTPNVQPLNRESGVHLFANGEWVNQYGAAVIPGFNDFTDVAVMPASEDRYYASAGDGLLRVSGNLTEIINENSPGSPLVNPDSPQRGLIIPGLASGTDGLWMINYNSPTPVLRLSTEGVWTAFSIPLTLARFAVQIELFGDLVWLRIAPSRGGGLVVFQPGTGEARYLNMTPGNGSLPSMRVNDMELDKDGFLWLATDAGVTVITNPFTITGDINAVEPVFEGRPLLIDEEVTAIEVDGGNRKWIGTGSGAWLFDPAADALLLRFTASTSPLPSDDIIALGIDGKKGEVFFGTPAGLVSYRADATEATSEHQQVKIFPNPVRSDFQGSVGISGLAMDVEVKITDSAGRLVFRTRSNGGTASWDITNEKLQTGIYMVFSASPDGEETFVGKIAIIR